MKTIKKQIIELFKIYKGADREFEIEDDENVSIRRCIYKTLQSKACFYDDVKKLIFCNFVKEECKNIIFARGLCKKHYQQFLRNK